MAVNLCGNACARTATGGERFASRRDAVDHVSELVSEARPDVVGVNEACSDQKDALLERLADYVYLARYNGRSVCGGEAGRHYMNVLLVRRDVFAGESLRLTYLAQARSDLDRGEHRTLLCAAVGAPRVVQVCVTHLTAGDGNRGVREDQLGEARSAVHRLAGDGPAAMIGDLNEGGAVLRRWSVDPFTHDASAGAVMHVLLSGAAPVGQRSYTRLLDRRSWSDHPALLVRAELPAVLTAGY